MKTINITVKYNYDTCEDDIIVDSKDYFSLFLNEKTTKTDSVDDRITKTDLYKMYKRWLLETHRKKYNESMRSFLLQMRRLNLLYMPSYRMNMVKGCFCLIRKKQNHIEELILDDTFDDIEQQMITKKSELIDLQNKYNNIILNNSKYNFSD